MITFGTLFTESVKEVEDLNEQIQLLDEMPGANMDTRAVHKHLKKQGWSLTRSSGGHDVFTHPDAKHHIPVPRHRQLKAPLVRGILKQSEVRKEEVEQIDELSKTTLGSYVKKAAFDLGQKGISTGQADSKSKWAPIAKKMNKRTDSIVKATDRLTKEDTLQEGRPSQRHPLEGHEYHRKTDAELEYIAKDAHKAAEAMKSHNTAAENKYRDQASDSATVRYFRKKNGMPNWYKKKYGHVNEETSKHAGWIAHYNGQKHEIPKEHAKDLYDAKQKAIAHFKAPKSKHGLIAIKPAYNEEVVNEGAKSAGVGWMLKADPKLGAKVDANKKKFKAFKKAVGNKDAGKKVIKEDDVINMNAVNSVHAQPKKKSDVDRYMTGQSKVVSGTNVVASPRESVQESIAMDIAKMAARRNGKLSENNDNTLSSYDKEDTPAKKSLSATAGMVKNLAKDAKAKAKTKKSDDTFQPEPELASNIVR